MVKCRYGRLSSPVRNASGKLRKCKLRKKTKKGRKADRKTSSKEFHEVRYRREKRAMKKNVRSIESSLNSLKQRL